MQDSLLSVSFRRNSLQAKQRAHVSHITTVNMPGMVQVVRVHYRIVNMPGDLQGVQGLQLDRQEVFSLGIVW